MRTITSHIVNPANDKLTIAVVDAPGSGGANHAYLITGMDYFGNPSAEALGAAIEAVPLNPPVAMALILFQNGPIAEAGVNGITHEALLAILIDRLECFQAGPFASVYNHTALDHLRDAQTSLQARTRERMARNVEGTHQP